MAGRGKWRGRGKRREAYLGFFAALFTAFFFSWGLPFPFVVVPPSCASSSGFGWCFLRRLLTCSPAFEGPHLRWAGDLVRTWPLRVVDMVSACVRGGMVDGGTDVLWMWWWEGKG